MNDLFSVKPYDFHIHVGADAPAPQPPPSTSTVSDFLQKNVTYVAIAAVAITGGFLYVLGHHVSPETA
jgi:hypothetical protein